MMTERVAVLNTFYWMPEGTVRDRMTFTQPISEAALLLGGVDYITVGEDALERLALQYCFAPEIAAQPQGEGLYVGRIYNVNVYYNPLLDGRQMRMHNRDVDRGSEAVVDCFVSDDDLLATHDIKPGDTHLMPSATYEPGECEARLLRFRAKRVMREKAEKMQVSQLDA